MDVCCGANILDDAMNYGPGGGGEMVGCGREWEGDLEISAYEYHQGWLGRGWGLMAKDPSRGW
jgi:hypothetical protein